MELDIKHNQDIKDGMAARLLDAVRLILSGALGGIAVSHVISMTGIFTMTDSIEKIAMVVGAGVMAIALKKTGLV